MEWQEKRGKEQSEPGRVGRMCPAVERGLGLHAGRLRSVPVSSKTFPGPVSGFCSLLTAAVPSYVPSVRIL